MINVKLFDDDVWVCDISPYDVTIDVDGDRPVRSTARLTTAYDDADKFIVPNRMVKIYHDDEPLFTGYIDDVLVVDDVDDQYISVSMRDKSKRMKESTFTTDFSYYGPPDVNEAKTITNITASSYLGVNAKITYWGRLFAESMVVKGDPASPVKLHYSGSLLDGHMKFINIPMDKAILYTGKVDMGHKVSMKSIALAGNKATNIAITTSMDGVIFTQYNGGVVDARYITVFAEIATLGDLSFEVRGNSSYPATNLLLSDDTQYRPNESDISRQVILTLAANTSVNGIYLRLGSNDVERHMAYSFSIYGSKDNSSWLLLGDYSGNGGICEACFNNTTVTYLKIKLKSPTDSNFAIRQVKPIFVNLTNKMDSIIFAVAATDGEVHMDLAPTITRGEVLFSKGSGKWDSLFNMVSQALGNYKLFYDGDGVLRLSKVIFDKDMAITVNSLLPPIRTLYSDAEIKNELLVCYEGVKSGLSYTAINNDVHHKGSIPRIGRRAATITTPFCDTMEKLMSYGKKMLYQLGRQIIPIEAEMVYTKVDPYDLLRYLDEDGKETHYIVLGYQAFFGGEGNDVMKVRLEEL